MQDGARFEALQAAIKAHFAYTKDCLLGAGVDRHLMGLYILAYLEGMDPMPSIFSDRGVKVAGRYTLSTSNISMRGSPLFGGFAPMVSHRAQLPSQRVFAGVVAPAGKRRGWQW